MALNRISENKNRADAGSGNIKQELLLATIRLLNEKGREGATMRAICAEVGVTPPTLYHHYGDLQGLHQAAIDQTYLSIAKVYQDSAEKEGALKGMRVSWGTLLEFARSEPNMCRIVLQQVAEGSTPDVVTQSLQAIAADLSHFHRQGLLKYSPEDCAQLLWMTGLGALTYIVSKRDEAELQELGLPFESLEFTLQAIFGGKLPD